jgi:hypothetical protein
MTKGDPTQTQNWYAKFPSIWRKKLLINHNHVKKIELATSSHLKTSYTHTKINNTWGKMHMYALVEGSEMLLVVRCGMSRSENIIVPT